MILLLLIVMKLVSFLILGFLNLLSLISTAIDYEMLMTCAQDDAACWPPTAAGSPSLVSFRHFMARSSDGF